MIGQEQATTVIGHDVYDNDGDKIGTVGQVWADGVGQPAWASVRTGFFGMNESLVRRALTACTWCRPRN